MIHQDCYNKYYIINYFKDYIEVEINFVPKDNFNKSKIYFDLVVYYKIKNTIIKYNGKIFYNKETFLFATNIRLNLHNNKNIKLFQ